MSKSAPTTPTSAGPANDEESSAIAHVSHEMRSPIHMILGLVELMVSEGDLNNRQRGRLDTIGRVADSLSLMLDDLLDFSKISAGHMELAEQPFSPAATADSIGRSFTSQAAKKGIRFSIAVEPDVPLNVLGDRNRLRQVLTNLVSNAIKFTDVGFVRLDIHPVDGDNIRFSVVDTGPGIPEHAQASIFNPYQQATVEHSNKGTGLGLAISHKLVELMGGELNYSTNTTGTTFWCDIPFAPARRSTDQQQPQLLPTGAGQVLVVDDSEVNRMLASSQLEHLGYTPATASSGQEALRMLNSSETYKAVLMDWHMPGMDGLEATRTWREQEDGDPLPIIMVTASVLTGDREACLESGASDYLAKPASINDIAAALGKWVEPDDAETTSDTYSGDQTVKRLVAQLGSEDVVLPLLEAYISTLPDYVAAARDGRDTNDAKSVVRAAHTIRPAAEMIGETQLSEISADLESEAKKGLGPTTDDLVRRFIEECEQSKTRMTQIVEQLHATERHSPE